MLLAYNGRAKLGLSYFPRDLLAYPRCWWCLRGWMVLLVGILSPLRSQGCWYRM